MSTGYKLKADDLGYLLRTASPAHRDQIDALVKAAIRMEDNSFRFFDSLGLEISLSELHRRSQADPEVQRSIYNLWMSYAR